MRAIGHQPFGILLSAGAIPKCRDRNPARAGDAPDRQGIYSPTLLWQPPDDSHSSQGWASGQSQTHSIPKLRDSPRFTGRLEEEGIAVSMDGRGRALDNVFVERLWRSLKYEDIYLKEYQEVLELIQGITDWFRFYNTERPHQSLDYQTPESVYRCQG
jgi:transposase InsO family protein